jgi:hypothetical protein
VTIPLSTAFYNIFVMLGAFPPLDPTEEKRPQHHLRYHNSSSSLPTIADGRSPPPPASSSPDPLLERRRAKAMKVGSSPSPLSRCLHSEVILLVIGCQTCSAFERRRWLGSHRCEGKLTRPSYTCVMTSQSSSFCRISKR